MMVQQDKSLLFLWQRVNHNHSVLRVRRYHDFVLFGRKSQEFDVVSVVGLVQELPARRQQPVDQVGVQGRVRVCPWSYGPEPLR